MSREKQDVNATVTVNRFVTYQTGKDSQASPLLLLALAANQASVEQHSGFDTKGSTLLSRTAHRTAGTVSMSYRVIVLKAAHAFRKIEGIKSGEK